jgi:hypothetical protein
VPVPTHPGQSTLPVSSFARLAPPPPQFVPGALSCICLRPGHARTLARLPDPPPFILSTIPSSTGLASIPCPDRNDTSARYRLPRAPLDYLWCLIYSPARRQSHPAADRGRPSQTCLILGALQTQPFRPHYFAVVRLSLPVAQSRLDI